VIAAVLAVVLGASLLSLTGSASALSNRKGRLDDRGFPHFYMDEAGRALQMCDDGSLVCQGVRPAALTPPEGEAFYWVALTPLQTKRGRLDVEMALEAAFVGERPVVFRRIRVRGHLRQRGRYILRHPYGSIGVHAITPREERNVDVTIDVPCSLQRGLRCAPRWDRFLKSTARRKGYVGTTRRTTVTGGTQRNNVFLVARDNGRVIGKSKKFRIVGKVCGAQCRARR